MSGPALYPAGYEGECESCQEHAELFHAQHEEDRHRMPPPLPFCRPCAEYALTQLQAEQAQIEQEDEAYAAHLAAEAARTAPLEEERHRAAAAAWADAADRRDRERTDAYTRELRQDDAP